MVANHSPKTPSWGSPPSSAQRLAHFTKEMVWRRNYRFPDAHAGPHPHPLTSTGSWGPLFPISRGILTSACPHLSSEKGATGTSQTGFPSLTPSPEILSSPQGPEDFTSHSPRKPRLCPADLFLAANSLSCHRALATRPHFILCLWDRHKVPLGRQKCGKQMDLLATFLNSGSDSAILISIMT